MLDPHAVLSAGIPQQNYIGFANQPGAPVGALLVVNAGDILQQAGLGWSTFPQQITIELAASYVIPGSETSAAAALDLPGSPFATWPPVTPIYFTPAS